MNTKQGTQFDQFAEGDLRPVNNCPHETIGRGMIQHEGISHPGGQQICLDCRKPLREIIEEVYKKGEKEGQARMNNSGRLMYQQGYDDGLRESALRVDKTMVEYMATLEGSLLIEEIKKKAKEEPMGVSQWKSYGKKNGYWQFFEEEIKKHESH